MLKLIPGIFFLFLVGAFILNMFLSIRRRDKFSKWINKYKEKEVLNDGILYKIFPYEKGHELCDVCLVKGGIIIFSVDRSFYFFCEGSENKQFSSRASICGCLQELDILEGHTLKIHVRFTKTNYFFRRRKSFLKFQHKISSLKALFIKYSIEIPPPAY